MKKLLLLSVMIAITAASSGVTAQDKEGDRVQRKATGVIDVQKNTVSNIELSLVNNGILGFNPQTSTGATLWPRGSMNQYIYGSGLWFGARKMNPDKSGLYDYVEIGYNPNTGRCWFVPGMVKDGDSVREDLADKYRLYFSTDFNQSSGKPLLQDDGPNWPLWVSDKTKKYQYGTYKHDYVADVNKRNETNYPNGPLFVSDEDIISMYKDTDLNEFDGGAAKRKALGYPLGLQIQSSVYSWNNVEMKDVLIISDIVENTSQDTLLDCWVGGFYDIDLLYSTNGPAGASNDRAKFFIEDESLNLGVAWTETSLGEAGKGFGYIGISFLETPAVDKDAFIRNDKLIFEPTEQLGLKTFATWNIEDDQNSDERRYQFMSSMTRDEDTGPGDKRMFLATGPFNMRPGDKARVVFAINFAMPAKGGEADGTLEDIEGFTGKAVSDKPQVAEYNTSLTGKLKMVKDRYYNIPAVLGAEDYTAVPTVLRSYPNPATDNLYIDCPDGAQHYEIVSLEGIRVATGEFSGSIDVSALVPGFYQVRIGNNISKFIKM